jgi:hypothetical protein
MAKNQEIAKINPEELINGNRAGRLVFSLFGKKIAGHWIGGALSNRYQEIIAPWINSTPKRMTVINASVFGTFGAFQYFVAGEGTGYLASQISDGFGTPFELTGYLFALFEIAQNGYRVGYALRHEKGHVSISPTGFAGTAIFYLAEKMFGGKSNAPSRINGSLDERL